MAVSAHPRVLWATDEEPDRAQGGGNVRQAHLLGALASRAPTDLLLLGELRDDAVRRALASVAEVPHPAPWTPPASVRRAASLPMAVSGWRHWEHVVTRRTRAALAAALAERAERYDLVVVVHELMAPAIPPVRRGAWAVEFQHVLSAMFDQHADTRAGRRAWLHRRQAVAARRLERHVVTAYDVVVACSDDDVATLSAVAGTGLDAVVAPNGVDVESFRATRVPDAPRVLLPATLDFAPNVDGVLWFCDEVLPIVQAARPDATFDIVGRRPVPAVQALAARPGVAVHADVPSMAPWFDRAAVVVVPLRVGTGSRLKALEAMASSRPLVGTTIGLGGLDAIAGEHAAVADEPEPFARAVVALLDDRDAAGRMGAAGRRLVEERYDWRGIGARYADELLARVPVTARG